VSVSPLLICYCTPAAWVGAIRYHGPHNSNRWPCRGGVVTVRTQFSTTYYNYSAEQFSAIFLFQGRNCALCNLTWLLHSWRQFGGWWRWALLSPDGVAPIRMVGVSACVNLSLDHKVQKFSSGTGSPGWSWKKRRKMLLCVCEDKISALTTCQNHNTHTLLSVLNVRTIREWHVQNSRQIQNSVVKLHCQRTS